MSILNKIGEPYLSWIRFVGTALVIGVIAFSYYKVFMMGKEVCQLESAKAELEALKDGVKKFNEDVATQRAKNAQAIASAQNLSAKLYGLGETLRGLNVGGCDIPDERLRVMDEAATAVNATGFAGAAGTVRPVAGAPKEHSNKKSD